MDRQAKLTIFLVLVIFCGVILVADWLTRPEPGTEEGLIAPVLRDPARPLGPVNISGELPSLPPPPPPPEMSPFHDRGEPGPGAGNASGSRAPGWTPFTHVIKKGDTLEALAKTYYGHATEWKRIVEANPGLAPANLKGGQAIKIPSKDPPAGAPYTGASPAPAKAPTDGKYVVKSGDTLEKIARDKLGDGTRWPEIVNLNPGLDPSHLKVGTTLGLPEKP